MANEVLFWHGEKVKALASGRKLGLDNVHGFLAATGTLTNDGTNVTALDTVTIDQSVYTFVTALTEAKAAGTLTGTGTQPANGDTVTVGGVTYTFQTTLTNVAGNVHIGASAAASLTNLFHAINASGGTSGTDYAALCVANPLVVATNPSGTTVVATAIALGANGNNIATTTTGTAQVAWGNPNLTGGVNSNPNEVLVGGSNTASMTHLYEAINAGANGGTDYSTATVAHPTVSATNPSGTTVVLTGLGLSADGDTGNSIVTTETSAHLSFGGATLSGGFDANIIVDTVTGFPGYETFALVTSAGANQTYLLPVGDEAQEITMYFKTKGTGADAVVAGAFVGGTHLTFSAANQIAKLKFLNGSWLPLINTGSIA
jgi:hypothetical protein